MYQSVKVSAISLKPIKWDKASNAEKLEALFVEAAKDTPINIPHPPSTEAARQSEQEYLQAQGPEMAARYQKTIARTKS